MLDVTLFASAAVALAIGVLHRHLQRWSVSPPLLGLVAGVLLGPEVAGVLQIPPGQEHDVVHLAARLLLAVALMAVALRYPLSDVRRRLREVALLLLVVLPVMAAVVGFGAAWLLSVPLSVGLVLGAALSPTDPVLASGIVTGGPAERDIPARARQVLSLESGANDGLALPLVVLTIAVAMGRSMPGEAGKALYEVAAGIAVGGLAGLAAAYGLRAAKAGREVGPAVRSLYTLVLAFLVLGLGGLVRADGLLSVLVAGLVHNHVVTGADREAEVEVDEAMNQFLVVPVFLLLGAALPWRGWAELGWAGPAFVAFTLLLRRVPAVLALRAPLRMSWPAGLWLGWFGPIGVAALFYLGHVHQQGMVNPALWSAGTMVVAASTVAHGLTAGAGRLLFRRAHTAPDAPARHAPG